VPVLSSSFWSCLQQHMIKTSGSAPPPGGGGTGWGIGSYLISRLPCAPTHSYSIRLPLDHMDHKSLHLAKDKTPWLELDYWKRAVQGKTQRQARGPYRNYEVRLDANCRVEFGSFDENSRDRR
jgi:hypothetical protein